MAKKRYKVRPGVSGTHALLGISLIPGDIHEIEESLAGLNIFEEIKEGLNPPHSEQGKGITKKKDSGQAGMTTKKEGK